MKFSHFVLGSLLLAVGCEGGAASEDEMRNQQMMGPGGTMDGVEYPKGTVGFEVGQQVANLSFLWQKNGMLDAGKDPQKITLADFYAMRKDGARLLFLVGSAEWCNPCRIEAMQLQTALHDPSFLSYLDSKGGRNALQVVQVMFQKSDFSPADRTTIDTWTGALKLTYPVGIDPLSQISKYIPQNSIPQSLFIKLADMTLIGREVGSSTEPGAMEAKMKTYLDKVAP